MVSKASWRSRSRLSRFASEADATPPVPVLPPGRCWKSIFQLYLSVKKSMVNVYDSTQHKITGADVKHSKSASISYRTRSLGAEVSQDPLDRFSLHHMVLNCRWTIRPPFSDILKGRWWQPFKWQKWGKITYPLHLSLCHSDTKWDNAVYMHDWIVPLMPLHHVKFWWRSVQ